MNAAVESSRNENQRRRANLNGPKARGGSGDAHVDASQSLAVLIRVPNLDAPRTTARAASKAEAQDEPTTARDTSSRTSVRTKSTATAATAPAPSTSRNLIGWVWRMLILAAAVGLVVLAYRIINGPATVPMIDDAPTSANIVAESNNATTQRDPLATPPAQLAPHAGDIAAPSTLAPPKLELETPPVQVSPVELNAAAAPPPSSGQEDYADRTSETPPDGRRPWATDVRLEEPRGDGSIRTARSDWNNGWDSGANNNQPPAHGDQADEHYENWDSNDQPASNYDYPETSPNTWRDDGRWESTPRSAPQQGSGAPQPRGATAPAWNGPAHSAMRPREPGVARLHGEIEQPPLRRNDERNRPGIY